MLDRNSNVETSNQNKTSVNTASAKPGHIPQGDVLKGPHEKSTTGWGSMPSTSVFRAVNFELYVKPNKYVMAFGVVLFTGCISYIVYMNLTDDRRRKTYVTLDEDGGTTVRERTSRWN